jgi:hypothetical protein
MVTRIKKGPSVWGVAIPSRWNKTVSLVAWNSPLNRYSLPEACSSQPQKPPFKSSSRINQAGKPTNQLGKKAWKKKNMNPKTLRNSTANLSMPCHPHHPCSLRSSTCLWTWSTATDLSALGTGGGQVVPTVLVVSRPPTTWPIPDQNLCLNHLSGAFQIIVHCKFLSSCAVDECWPQ